MSPRAPGLLLSCALATAGFAWWSWPLAGHLTTHTLVLADGPPRSAEQRRPEVDWGLILANDQNLSLWGAVDNARALLRGDVRGLMTQGQCFPMPRSTALGEHMFEVGVLAAPWWLASGEPVAAYNLSFLSALLVAAAGMFLFLHRHTSSVPASVAGAAAFAFAVPRLVDLPYHPAVIGTHWLPWVLWSFDRVLAREGPGAVAVFAATLLLASVTGSYPLIAVGIVGGVYGLAVLAERARRGAFDSGALAWSVAGVLPAAVVVGAVLAAYSGLLREWTLMSNPDTKFLVSARDYLPGGVLPAGVVALAGLAPLLLLRGAAGRTVAALAAATVAAFFLTTRLPLPGGAWSAYEALARQLPLLDAVRAPGKAGLAVVFGLQALGAIGWSRAMQRLSPRAASALAVLLVVVVFVEISPPRWARPLLGDGAAMQLREVAPPRERLDVLKAALPPGGDRRAVLDLPTGRMVKAPAALLDAAWHGHPTSACYNSLIPPTMREVYAMAARSHSRRGVDELAAAGFGYVIERPTSPAQPLSPTSFPEPARLLAFDAGLAIWALPLAGAMHYDPSQLALAVKGGATRAATFAPEPPHELDVEVTNRGTEMWAAPRPLRPLVAEVELRSDDGAVVVKARARGVLPLALAPGATTTVQLVMPQAPPPGIYAATVRIDAFADALVPARLAWAAAAR